MDNAKKFPKACAGWAFHIAKEIDVAPEQCLYIGDTNTDMKPGATAGMDTAGAL